MNAIYEWFGSIFGYPLSWFYSIFNNFGIAIIVFTIFTRLLLFPLTVYQQKSSAKMARINPKMQELQRRYANDKEKYNQALMELYQRENYSPSSGCLPMMIQMLLLLGLYQAIIKPFTCTFHIASEKVTALLTHFDIATKGAGYPEIKLVQAIQGVENIPQLASEVGMEVSVLERMQSFSNGFDFLGLDLLVNPSFNPINWNVILVVIVFAASVFSMKISNKITGVQAQAQGCNTNYMAIGMGLFSAIISLSTPSALPFYWTCSSLISPLQSWIVHKYFNANIINARTEAARVERLRLEEGQIISEIEARKGKLELKPVEPKKKEESKGEIPLYSSNSKKKKKKGKK